MTKLTTDNQEKLIQILSQYDGIASVKKEDSLVICTLKKEITTTSINRYVFNNGLVLSRLQKRKPTLEQQFLDLTNNN